MLMRQLPVTHPGLESDELVRTLSRLSLAGLAGCTGTACQEEKPQAGAYLRHRGEERKGTGNDIEESVILRWATALA